MIVKLSEIDDSLVVRGSMEASQFMSVENSEFHVASPVTYELTVRKFDNLVTLEGPIVVEALFTCGRCLEEFSQSLTVNMDIRLSPRSEASEASEFELKGEDMDVYYYDGDEIDIDPFVYDEVLLNMPVRPVCKEDCQGLCGVCGKNRNLETCSCSEKTDTLLGEKLKSFLN
ncbi:MAG TPA: DUF177 domain-containing protein [Syntrophorhabdaceae bacterium]|nr:DUF177 domain-containing protein [Syntrophorhabdaceae bacterium]